MRHAASTKAAKKKYRKRFKGIVADARALGCDRDHLRRCLNGERQSKSLLARYAALKKSKRIVAFPAKSSALSHP